MVEDTEEAEGGSGKTSTGSAEGGNFAREDVLELKSSDFHQILARMSGDGSMAYP